MTNRTKKGYWAEKLGFTCQDCPDYMIEDILRCPLQIELNELRETEEVYEIFDITASTPRKPLLRTYLSDFVSDFNKSKILRERTTRELETDEDEGLYEALLWRKKRVEDKIQKCLNKKHYLAVVKRKYLFRNQHLRIADCRLCENYWALHDYCQVNYELKNMRGICPLYKFGKRLDFTFKEVIG